MATDNSSIRLRKLQQEAPFPRVEEVNDSDEVETPKKVHKKKSGKRKRKAAAEEDDYTPWVDILRVLSFLFCASCALSYLISDGESFFWGMKEPPNYLQRSWWKEKIFGSNPAYLNPVRYMTLEELAAYDGTDEEKPLYLAINGSIYDVSAGRNFYGPGGAYHGFAGVDASRSFVTGCFKEDRNGDLRGVELMYLPLDDPQVDKHWTPEELAKKKEEELAYAKEQVYLGLKHWVDFFSKSKKYHYVGQVLREPGWEGELKPLCQPAQDSRSRRKIPGQKEEEEDEDEE